MKLKNCWESGINYVLNGNACMQLFKRQMSCKYEIIFKVFGSKKTEGPNQDSQH
jgi:hypothetical protein